MRLCSAADETKIRRYAPSKLQTVVAVGFSAHAPHSESAACTKYFAEMGNSNRSGARTTSLAAPQQRQNPSSCAPCLRQTPPDQSVTCMALCRTSNCVWVWVCVCVSITRLFAQAGWNIAASSYDETSKHGRCILVLDIYTLINDTNHLLFTVQAIPCNPRLTLLLSQALDRLLEGLLLALPLYHLYALGVRHTHAAQCCCLPHSQVLPAQQMGSSTLMAASVTSAFPTRQSNHNQASGICLEDMIRLLLCRLTEAGSYRWSLPASQIPW